MLRTVKRTDQEPKSWSRVIADLEGRLLEIERKLQGLREEEARLAAACAKDGGAEQALALDRLRNTRKRLVEERENAERSREGALQFKEEEEAESARRKRARAFAKAARVAKQRLALAREIEQLVAEVVRDFEKLDKLGRDLASLTPDQPPWLRAGRPAYGDHLLRSLRMAFLQAGLRLDSSLYVDSGQLSREAGFAQRIANDDQSYLTLERK